MKNVMPTCIPPGFRDRFIKDGWRGIERYYGARTSLMMDWINQCGGIEVLQAERRVYRDAQFDAAKLKIAPRVASAA